jgi:hypothetical protein
MLLVVVNGPLAVTTRTGRPWLRSTWTASKRALFVVGVGAGTGCDHTSVRSLTDSGFQESQARTSRKRLTTIGFRASSNTPSRATIYVAR